MSTGSGNSDGKRGARRNGKSTFSVPQAIGLRFERGRLVVELADGREVSVPLDRYPSLHESSADARSRWKLIGQGTNQGFHWPNLDLDLSVAGLTNGLAEAIPRPPKLIGATAVLIKKARRSA
jgi:hypothetical protein